MTSAGIPQSEAEEFAAILETERPDDDSQPYGTRAREWLGKNIGKAASGVWKAGLSVATNVLQEAALRYYGWK